MEYGKYEGSAGGVREPPVFPGAGPSCGGGVGPGTEPPPAGGGDVLGRGVGVAVGIGAPEGPAVGAGDAEG